MRKFSDCLRLRYGDALVNTLVSSTATAYTELVDCAKAAHKQTVRLVNPDRWFTGKLGLFTAGVDGAMVDDVTFTTTLTDTDALVVAVRVNIVVDTMPHVDLIRADVDIDGQLAEYVLTATVPLGNVEWAERLLMYVGREYVTTSNEKE